MEIVERFLAYADDFEKSYVDDDWSRIGPYFTSDAVYEGEPPGRGRDGVLAKLRGGVDNLDRRMHRRIPEFEPPRVEDSTLTMRWKVTYQRSGVPDLVISGIETAEFEGDRIARLRDDLDPDALSRLGAWMAAHGHALRQP